MRPDAVTGADGIPGTSIVVGVSDAEEAADVGAVIGAHGICTGDDAFAWDVLRARASRYTRGAGLPTPAGSESCVSCQGPCRAGHARCFHCSEHAESAPGMLADAVAPVAYAPKGSRLARDLWEYKSGSPGSGRAGARLLGLLLVFLHDHGHEVWQRASMPAPTHACVVPSGRGRQGTHPLRSLVAGCIALPWVRLQPHEHGGPGDRALNPDRFRLAQSLSGARVLLLDDTWTSGASAQSAAVALKRGGARSVAVVVLGRHLTAGNRWLPVPGTRWPGPFSARPQVSQVNRL